MCKLILRLVTSATIIIFGFCENSDWPTHGLTISNKRNVNDITESNPIDSNSVKSLKSAWNFTTSGPSSATPAIKGVALYECCFDGNLYAINKKTGAHIWTVQISAVTGISGDYCRSTPALHSDRMVLGAQISGYLLALELSTGALIWKVKPNPHPLTLWTMSGTIYGEYIYIGASSSEESAAADPNYPCCSFRGSFHKIGLKEGNVVWTFWGIDLSLPTGPGQWSGVGIWGSSPAIDLKRQVVYIGTGNPYDVPASVQACAQSAQNANTDPSPCTDARVRFNSAISLDIHTGAIKWVARRTNYDAWVVACIFGGKNCPATPGADADFGMAPVIVHREHPKKDVLLIAQKSGVSWSLDPDTGDVIWGVTTGPGGSLGGSSWGSASDGKHYYVGNINSHHIPFALGPPANIVNKGGGWTALDIDTGAFVWEQVDPAALSPDPTLSGGSAGAGPGTLVNDVLLVASAAKDGQLYAINKHTGAILWHASTGGTVYGGASVSDGCVYLGSGYSPLANPDWTVNNKILAFCLPGH